VPRSPAFSIIVPAWERIDSLGACLRALEGLEGPAPEHEILVVDDGSRLPLAGRLKRVPPNARFVRLSENQGPAAARNRGADQAAGEWLVFLDSDCRPRPDWLRKLARHLETHPGAAVGGRILEGCPANLFCAASQAILDFVYSRYNEDRSDAKFVTTANLAAPAAAFREVGGFDPGFRTSEDRDFCARWTRRGFRIVYAEDAVVEHTSPIGLPGFLRRHYHYGRGARRFRSRQPGAAGRSLEPARFYWGMISYAWRREPGPRSLLIGLLVLLSQAATAIGYVSEWRHGIAAGGSKLQRA
jgi:GT2 family glycosyltransferase